MRNAMNPIEFSTCLWVASTPLQTLSGTDRYHAVSVSSWGFMVRPDHPNTQSPRVDEIRARVNRLPAWRHRIPLGHGIVTPGREDSNVELARIDLPEDLTGLQILDIGCSDGFFCFECEKRGAARVVGGNNFGDKPIKNLYRFDEEWEWVARFDADDTIPPPQPNNGTQQFFIIED